MMLKRLRTILASVPVVTAVVLFALYLLGGFLALPAIVKWQVEKQVPAQLGHPISVGEVRFNPLTFRFEVDDLTLSDPEGSPMLAFKRLLIDFELRSIVDRAWTFAEVSIEAPLLDVRVDRNGRHNFATLLERLPASEPAADDEALPRFIVQRVALADGRLEYADELLDEPLVTHLEPLQIAIDKLSSLPEQAASYQLSARTRAGEVLEASGELALHPLATKGRLTLRGLEVKTLARSLVRLLSLDAPAGKVDLAGNFDLAVDQHGIVSGSVHDLGVDVDSLSLSAAGAGSPLLTFETLSLQQGSVDLGKRESSFAALRLAKGRIGVAVDAQGRIDWTTLARVSAPRPQKSTGKATEATTEAATDVSAAALPAAVPAGESPAISASAPWRFSVASAEISEIAFAFADPAQRLAASVAAIGLQLSLTGEFGTAGTRLEFERPKLSISTARLQRGADSSSLSGAAVEAGHVQIVAAEAIAATIDEPTISATGIALAGSGQSAQLRDLSLAGRRLSLKSGSAGVELLVEQPHSTLAGLQIKRAADALDLHSATIGGETLSLAQADGRFDVAGKALRVSLATLAAAQGADRLAVRGVSFEAGALSAASARSAGAAAASFDARLDRAALQLKAVGVVAQGASAEVAQLAAANFGASSVLLAVANGPLELRGDGLSASLSDALFRSPADATEMLQLESATLSGGTFSLHDRVATAEKLALARGAAQTWFDTEGRFNGLVLTRGAAAAAVAAAPAERPDATQEAIPDATPAVSETPAPAGAAWRVAVNSLEVDGFALGFEDRRGSPQLAVGLEQIRARIAGFETGVSSPMQVEFKAKVASGGAIEVGGSVRADNGTSDLQLKLTGVALGPVQPYLSEFAELTLASGTMSSAGRLRYGDRAGAGANLAYQGSFAVDRLQLDEVEPKRPFLAWESVASGDVLLTVEPNRLDIGELRVVRPSGRLIIAEDHSVNLTDVLKKRPQDKDQPVTGEQVPEPQDAALTADAPSASAPDPFPVTVARLRVSGGVLEFADLSLRPQFGARMHELKGVITGLGTDPNGSAKVQLDARVDKYGSAKIRGQLSVFRPEKLTDIEMTFRNVAMSSLSPYSVKFAGYRIVGGRLALDLQYKVKDGKLLGQNKIVLKHMELGEKVDSPDAADLPLELAIAILTDSEGVIDIGLPVSGDLNDPQFDYGAVIGKALGNLLGGIITAPFRALGALFGGGGEQQLDSIDFDPGSDVLGPPERQKLAAVARAMNERQTLKLVVPPTYAPVEDCAVLKLRAVHSDLVRRMGIELAAGEDPGPIDPANPRAQRAIEAAFSDRYAPEVFAALQRRALAAAGQPAAGSPAVATPPVVAGVPTAAAPPPVLPPAFYQQLLDRLIGEQTISDETLAQLASRRGEAIVGELTTVGGLAAARVSLGETRPAGAANDQAVTVQLQLEVAK